MSTRSILRVLRYYVRRSIDPLLYAPSYKCEDFVMKYDERLPVQSNAITGWLM